MMNIIIGESFNWNTSLILAVLVSIKKKKLFETSNSSFLLNNS